MSTQPDRPRPVSTNIFIGTDTPARTNTSARANADTSSSSSSDSETEKDTATATHSEQPFRLYTAASLGRAIRHYRQQAGLTQAELAEMAGLNRSYLSELEQGGETEQVRRIIRLLKLLGARATVQKADW